MELFYGWVIVGVGIVVTCIGLGTMMSLGVFLQPMRRRLGWSRTGISTAAMLNFLCHGVRLLPVGRAVRPVRHPRGRAGGGVLLGLGLIAREPGHQASAVPAPVRRAGRPRGGQLLCADDRDDDALVHPASQPCGGARLGRLGDGIADSVAPLARWLISPTTGAPRCSMLGCSPGGGHARCLADAPAAGAGDIAGAGPAACATDREFTVAQALRTPQFAAIALTHFACCAAHSGPIFHMVSYAIDCGVPAMAAATVFGTAGLASLSGRVVCGLDRRPRRREADTDRRPGGAGGGHQPLSGRPGRWRASTRSR